MTQALAEVPESEAEGKIKAAYDDIKATLRSPRVPQVFLSLSAHPDYLTLAWTALKPNAQTIYLERQADAVRLTAVDLVATLGTPPEIEDAIAPLLRALHYTRPKVFLVTAALRSATGGSRPQMQYLSPDDKRQIPRGVPDGMQPVGDPSVPDEQVQAMLTSARQLLGEAAPLPELRVLASSPEYAQRAWSALQPILSRPELEQARRVLRQRAEQAITGLPFRMDLAPHALRQGGLSDLEIDEVREILERAYVASTTSVLSTAFLAIGIGGREEASSSPFPV